MDRDIHCKVKYPKTRILIVVILILQLSVDSIL